MVIYLTTFTLSCILLFFSERVRADRSIKNVLALLGIAIPCVLAGLRHESIGTDVRVYVKPLFELASNSDSFIEFLNQRWFHVWRYKYVYQFESGFNALVYLNRVIFGTLPSLLLAIQVFINVPIYLGLRRLKNHIPTWLGMLIFYLTLFNTSLNMMRQSIAMSIIFMGTCYFLFEGSKHNRLYFSVCVVIGSFFHLSALLGLLLLIIDAVLYSTKEKTTIVVGKTKLNSRFLKLIVLISIASIVLMNTKLIVQILENLKLLRFVNYIDGELMLLERQFIVRMFIVILFILNWKKITLYFSKAYFLFAMLILDLVTSQYASIYQYSSRISEYFGMFGIITLPMIIFANRSKKMRWILGFGILSYSIFIWVYIFVFRGSSETIPYLFN